MACWIVEDPATGKPKERARVVGSATMTDEQGWERVGVLKAEGVIRMDDDSVRPEEVTFGQLASFYFARKRFKKVSTKELHEQIVNGILVPRWGARIAMKIEPWKIKD